MRRPVARPYSIMLTALHPAAQAPHSQIEIPPHAVTRQLHDSPLMSGILPSMNRSAGLECGYRADSFEP